MTKKDYIKIAEIFRKDLATLKGSKLRPGYVLAIGAFTRFAREQNSKFNEEKFGIAVFNL